jgi:hypothetical protein
MAVLELVLELELVLAFATGPQAVPADYIANHTFA